MLQISKPPAGSRSKGPSCIRQLRDSAPGTPVGARARPRPGVAAQPHLVTSRTRRQRQTRNGRRKKRPGSAGSGGRQPEPASESSRAVAARGHAHRHQPKVTRHRAGQGQGRGTLFPCLAFASLPSRLSFPLALRLHQLEPLPSTHHLTSLPSSSSLPPGRNAARRGEPAAGMPAQKRPLPSSASPGPDAHVEEAPGADADGCGGGVRRSPKPTLNGVEERDGGPRQAKDRRHGTTGLSKTRGRGPPTRVIFLRCAYASRGAASVWVSLSACLSHGLGRFRR